AEVEVAAQDLGEEEVLLFLGAVPHDRRADRVDREHRDGYPCPGGLVEEDELLDRGPPLPAVLDGPPDAGPPVRAHLLPDAAGRGADSARSGELVLHGWWDELGEVRAELGPERQLLVGV